MEHAWGNANFGPTPKRDIIKETLLKCASGYYSGFTAKAIVRELKLVKQDKWKLTKLGKQYLYEAFTQD